MANKPIAKTLRNFARAGRHRLDSLATRGLDQILMDRELLEVAVSHAEKFLSDKSKAGLAARGKSGRKPYLTPEERLRRRRAREAEANERRKKERKAKQNKASN